MSTRPIKLIVGEAPGFSLQLDGATTYGDGEITLKVVDLHDDGCCYGTVFLKRRGALELLKDLQGRL